MNSQVFSRHISVEVAPKGAAAIGLSSHTCVGQDGSVVTASPRSPRRSLSPQAASARMCLLESHTRSLAGGALGGAPSSSVRSDGCQLPVLWVTLSHPSGPTALFSKVRGGSESLPPLMVLKLHSNECNEQPVDRFVYCILFFKGQKLGNLPLLSSAGVHMSSVCR